MIELLKFGANEGSRERDREPRLSFICFMSNIPLRNRRARFVKNGTQPIFPCLAGAPQER